MKTRTKSGETTEKELVLELIALLKSDPSDKAAAMALLQLIEAGQVEPSVALSCYRSAVRQVYFPSAAWRRDEE